MPQFHHIYIFRGIPLSLVIVMKMMNVIVILLCIALFASGCNIINERKAEAIREAERQKNLQNQPPATTNSPTDSPTDSPGIEPTQLFSCTYNAECPSGNVCVEDVCRKLADLPSFSAECSSLCTTTNVVLKTNTGETHDIATGRGSYTSAGALEWKTERMQHCEGDPFVPVRISLMNYGKAIGEYYIVLSEGETSEKLTHPTISSVAFQLTVEDITSECAST